MFFKYSESLCLFQNDTFFSLINLYGLFFWDGLLPHEILRKENKCKKCKYWMTEMWK